MLYADWLVDSRVEGGLPQHDGIVIMSIIRFAQFDTTLKQYGQVLTQLKLDKGLKCTVF